MCVRVLFSIKVVVVFKVVYSRFHWIALQGQKSEQIEKWNKTMRGRNAKVGEFRQSLVVGCKPTHSTPSWFQCSFLCLVTPINPFYLGQIKRILYGCVVAMWRSNKTNPLLWIRKRRDHPMNGNDFMNSLIQMNLSSSWNACFRIKKLANAKFTT